MLANEVNGLRVIQCESESAERYGDDGSFGWRILIVRHDVVYPMRFARQCDAVAAMHAIAGVTDWNGEFIRISKIKWTQLRTLMLGALQW